MAELSWAELLFGECPDDVARQLKCSEWRLGERAPDNMRISKAFLMEPVSLQSTSIHL